MTFKENDKVFRYVLGDDFDFVVEELYFYDIFENYTILTDYTDYTDSTKFNSSLYMINLNYDIVSNTKLEINDHIKKEVLRYYLEIYNENIIRKYSK